MSWLTVQFTRGKTKHMIHLSQDGQISSKVFLLLTAVCSSNSVHSQFKSAGKRVMAIQYTCLGDNFKNNFHFLHTGISRNTIITLSRDKTVSSAPMLTIGTLVPLITFITIIVAITPMANLFPVNSKQSWLSLVFHVAWY